MAAYEKNHKKVHKVVLSVLDSISSAGAGANLGKESRADSAPDLQTIEEQTCTSQDEIPNAAISKVEMESVRRRRCLR